jgi:uncharacterized protein (TIGR02391 family)
VEAVEMSSTNKSGALLTVVAKVFDEYGEWPVRQYVEARLEQDHDLELDDCLAAMPRALVAAAGHGEDSEVALRVAGLVAVGSSAIVERFIEALRWLVDDLGGSSPAHPGSTEEVRITSAQLRSEWSSRNVDVSDLDLKKLRALIMLEGVHAGFSGEGHDWSLLLSRRVFRPYREVEKIDDYLTVRAELESLTPVPAATAAPSMLPPGQAPEGAARGGFADAIADVVAPLIQDGHFASAAPEAIKVMAAVLREKSGLDLDGESLAGRALGPPDPLVRAVGVGGATGDSVQRGVMQMAQGIFQAARNPLAHSRLTLSRDEAMEIVAMASFVVRSVERGEEDRG